jgi:hypothetical protein
MWPGAYCGTSPSPRTIAALCVTVTWPPMAMVSRPVICTPTPLISTPPSSGSWALPYTPLIDGTRFSSSASNSVLSTVMVYMHVQTTEPSETVVPVGVGKAGSLPPDVPPVVAS